MVEREHGFSLMELMAALVIMGIVAAFTIPMAVTAVKNYRLHADATALASYLNIVRMRAASQFSPYRLVMQDPAMGGTGAYGMEKLCGPTPSIVDSNCTGTYPAYQPFTTRQFEVGVGGSSMGTQYLQAGNTVTGCRPTGVSGPPLTGITGDLSTSTPPCAAQLFFYFNTRGLPVNNTGSPLSNGGNVLYITNVQGLKDAITISIGGRVSVYNWSPSAAKWIAR